jgi:hypothetical protein
LTLNYKTAFRINGSSVLTNECLFTESEPTNHDKVHQTIKKTRNGYLIVQAVLNKFTAEIQNANSINKKVDFSLPVVYLVVNDGSK